MRPRRRAAVLVLGAAVLYMIGTNAQAGWLFVLAVLLLGATAAGVILSAGALRRLDVSIEAPDETRQGAPTRVDVRISNRGRATRWGVVAHDEHLGGATTWVGRIRPGEVVRVGSVRDAPRRGEAHPGWVELRSAAPFGVAERRRRLPVAGTTLVLPRTVAISPPRFVEASLAREPAARSEPHRGAGPEYLGVREYRPGDPVRHIHWRASAHHGELVVRDLEEERVPRLAIWIDTARKGETLDACCTAAASILHAASDTGAGVRLVAASDGGPIAATRGRVVDLDRWLARLAPCDVDVATSLGWLDAGMLRGVGSVALLAADIERLTADSVSRLTGIVPRVVIVPVGSVEPEALPVQMMLAAGADVVPWLDGEGLATPILRRVEASA